MQRGIYKQLLASLLVVIMLFGVVPLQSFAKTSIKGPTLEEAKAEYQPGDVLTNLSKEAKRTAEDEWEITLKFTPTRELSTAASYEVVLALDTTNSLGDEGLRQLKAAAEAVLTQLHKLSHETHINISLALLGFGGVVTDTKVVIPLTDLKSKDQAWLTTALNDIGTINMSNGTGTNYEEAFIKANDLFADSNKRQICVFLADGAPNRSNQLGESWNAGKATEHALVQAKVIKDSGKSLYTIYYNNNNNNVNAENLLKKCASDPDSEYYYAANNYSGLLESFEKIMDKLIIGKFEDYMGPNFELIDDHNRVEVNPNYGDGSLTKESIMWTPDKGLNIRDIEHKITYTVKADPTLQAGNYNDSETNGVTRFIYSVTGKEQVQQFFTSPTADFTKASAKIIVAGLPESITADKAPSLTSPELIYTGYSGNDRFEFKAPIYTIGGVTYKPTISYHAVASVGGSVQNGLSIDDSIIGQAGYYEIKNKDLGSGVYTIEVNYTKSHIVDFETFGGTPVPEVQLVPHNNTATEPTVEPVKPGHIFEGWYTSDDFGATLSNTKYNFSTKVENNITLYAKWTAIDYTAKFNVMGGDESTKPADQTNLKYGDLIIFPTIPTRTGHTFEGWHTSEDSGNTLSSEKYNFATEITGDITLYAKWAPIEHIVDFFTDGGTPVPPIQRVKHKGTAILPTPQPEKLGYTFEGWYTSDNFGATLSTTEYNFSTEVTKNITLYAKWTPIPPQPEKPQITIPQTGDNNNMMLWIVMVIVSSGAILFFAKKKNNNNDLYK